MNVMLEKEGRIVDGVVRTPEKLYQDYRKDDPNPGPDDVYGIYPEPGGDYTVPNAWYISHEHANLEKEKIWNKVWVFACREEKIPNVGSCYVHQHLDVSLLIVRTEENEIKAFRNTCRHRGNQLRRPGTCGVITKFFCPYHGATWKLDGSVDKWPFEFEFPSVKNGDYGLHEVHVAQFEGFVFINLDDDPTPFEEYIGPLRKMFNGISWQDRYPVLHVRKHLRCNWKTLSQAFQETMHVPITHPAGRPIGSTAGSQSDVLSKYLTRIINVVAVSGDCLNIELSEQEVLVKLLGIDSESEQAFCQSLPEDVRARDYFAQVVAERIKTEEPAGMDFSDRPTTELVDNLVYRLFPNLMILHAFNGATIGVFTPGVTPDECYFEIIWFEHGKPGQQKPPAPERIEISADQTFSEVTPGLPGFYTAVADEDTGNMEGQQLGFKSSPEGHCIFANYLESGIVHELKVQKELMGLN